MMLDLASGRNGPELRGFPGLERELVVHRDRELVHDRDNGREDDADQEPVGAAHTHTESLCQSRTPRSTISVPDVSQESVPDMPLSQPWTSRSTCAGFQDSLSQSRASHSTCVGLSTQPISVPSRTTSLLPGRAHPHKERRIPICLSSPSHVSSRVVQPDATLRLSLSIDRRCSQVERLAPVVALGRLDAEMAVCDKLHRHDQGALRLEVEHPSLLPEERRVSVVLFF
eukprot:1314213-Rhodomonas_salina.2